MWSPRILLLLPSLLSSKLSVLPVVTILSSIPGNDGQLEAFANPLPVEDGAPPQQQPIPLVNNDVDHAKDGGGGVSVPFFLSLERMARLVDIAYCVGTTGISKPFSCASRCKDFPTLTLTRTWNTGILMSDSCGYIAVDHGNSPTKGSGSGRDVEKDLAAEPAIIVAFRGTYSITNTIVDLSTIPQEYVPYPAPTPPPDDGDDDGDKDGNKKKRKERQCQNCTVHMGFLASWRNAREVVIPALREARDKHLGYPVHLVGHSLGGAVAALAALELRLSLGWQDVKVTTFGEPRIGNKALVRYLDEAFGLTDDTEGENLEYRRVTHVNDPVPLLPLSEWGFRSHAGEVFISKTDLPPNPEDLRICVGDHDSECSNGEEDDDAEGDWLSELLRRRRWGWPRWGRKSGSDDDSVEALDLDDNNGEEEGDEDELSRAVMVRGFPTRFKLWQLLFAHRDYFWRLGLCVPGGDPADWGRGRYNMSIPSGTADQSFEMKEDL